MTLVSKSVGICDGIVNPIYGCGVEITPGINSLYVGLVLSKGFQKYVGIGLVLTCLDLILS